MIWNMLKKKKTLRNLENEKCKRQDREYIEKTVKHGKCVTQTVGPGLQRETLKNVENEKCTLQDLEQSEKTEIPEK